MIRCYWCQSSTTNPHPAPWLPTGAVLCPTCAAEAAVARLEERERQRAEAMRESEEERGD